MPVKIPNKSQELASIKSGNTRGSLQKAGLFKVDSSGTILEHKHGRFLLNPSTWEETKSANWTQNIPPGQSDPVMQWLSSGPRTVNFDALVTLDTSYFDPYEESNRKVAEESSASSSFVAEIASSFFKVPNIVPRKNFSSTSYSSNSNTNSTHILDISDKLNYYRSLLYPMYDNEKDPKRLEKSPPLVVLYVGNTFGDLKTSGKALPGKARASSAMDLWVVSNIRIRITKQLQSLAPMEAVVTFQLIQYTIKSIDRSRFDSSIQQGKGRLRIG